MENFLSFSPIFWMDMLSINQVLIGAFGYDITRIILQILTFKEDVVNILGGVVTNFAI